METYTIVSWATIGALSILLYKYYAQDTKVPVRVAEHKAQPVRKEPKAKKPREKKAPALSEATPAATTSSFKPVNDSTDDDKLNNKEFARQLTLAKTGTKVTTKKAEEKKIKSIKQSRAQEKVPNVEEPSAPSSTAGIDADDDQSAEPSPQVIPADVGGVSDMLEAPAPGLKALRLTDTVKDDPKPKKAPKAPEPTLTKKQRQNKKKTEQKKADREAEEKERKTKMESQRRQARIAEGRPAQDGSSLTNKAANAWAEKTTNGSSALAVVAPLDTFEAPVPAKAKGSSNASDDWIKDLPSEEEQIQRVRQEALEDEWATVETKASKRKQRKMEDPTTAPSAEPTESIPSRPNGSVAKAFTSQSSFAALNTGNDSTDESDQSDAKPKETKTTKSFTKAPAPKAQVEVEWDI
ncbi:hypothetical protein MKZ38_003094 [Zalerion maritima]|uniref:Uncharacterized protein n=1 Tax=Zalerion maritima TaxID=339359 RepID=A0AAD5RWT1_9PEZI|nr:hypothetical protein MKZ38_003094 [Zalerion maritima]